MLPVERSDNRRDGRGKRDRKDTKGKESRNNSSHDNKNRDSKKNMSKEKSKYDAPLERALPTPLKKFVPSEEEKRDRRFFTITTDSEEYATRAALGYYMITDESLLQREVINKGPKRYFFFGPRKNTYKFSLDAHYKKLLLPFIIEILTLSHLDVRVKVAFKGDTLEVSFNGEDEGLLLRNRGELLQGLEQLMRLYLANKVTPPNKMRWKVYVVGQNNQRSGKEDRKNNDRGNNRGRGRAQGRQGGRRDNGNDKEREEKILQLAKEAKEKVVSSKEPFTLKPLDPRDRRIVHQHLSEDPEVKTTSLGDGRLKKIEVSLRQ
jgi:predicted RNA-binding protein Jag